MGYAILGLVPMSITFLGVILGIVNIAKRKTLFYFTLIICAVACFAIEELSLAVNLLCGIMDDVWVGTLGVFACNFFLFSANYGEIDTLVDEKGFPVSGKLVALIAPLLLALSAIAVFFIWKDYNMLCAVVFSILLLPAVPTSYFNVKHLLLEVDALGVLKVIRPCDIMSLVVYFMIVVYLFVLTFLPTIYIAVAAIALATALLGLALAAVKGMKIWETLI